MANAKVEWGLALPPGPVKGKIGKWMDDLDTVLPRLQGRFKSLWMPDHFQWGDQPSYEAWTVLSYMAARWTTFDVGGSVLSQSYRNPAALAKMSATLHILSGGRYILGIGAGWKDDEYRAYGYPFPPFSTRYEQLDETLDIIKLLWREPGQVTYHGKHYRVTDAYFEPKLDTAPPIMVGCRGDKMLLLTARHADWWNISDVNYAQFEERCGVLKRHCETIGRDPASIRATWFGRLTVAETEAEARRRATEWNREHYSLWTLDGSFVGTPAQVVEKFQQFVAGGCDYFMVEILGLDRPEVIDMVLEEVLPKV